MKFISSGLFFIAAGITDIALNQTGSHNLPINSGLLQIIGLCLFIIGFYDYIAEKKRKK